MESTPPDSRSKQRAPQRGVDDLPIFAMRRPPESAPAPRRRKIRVATWFAAAGLVAMLVGAWLLVPRGPDEGPATERPAGDVRPTIVIDAGHGGHDKGAVRNGLFEKDLTLDTALRLEKTLRRRGFPVVMTRRDDRFVDLVDRSKVANRIPRALFVSIHFNDSASAAGNGVETFYANAKVPPGGQGWSFAGWFQEKPEPPPDDNGLGLANAVQGAVVAGLGAFDRGVKQADYAVVRQTRCAAVLVEGGFINNPSAARAIATPEYRDRLAIAIADGVSTYHRRRLLDARQGSLAKGR